MVSSIPTNATSVVVTAVSVSPDLRLYVMVHPVGFFMVVSHEIKSRNCKPLPMSYGGRKSHSHSLYLAPISRGRVNERERTID